LLLFSFGGYGLALAALALVVFGAYDSYPITIIPCHITSKLNTGRSSSRIADFQSFTFEQVLKLKFGKKLL